MRLLHLGAICAMQLIVFHTRTIYGRTYSIVHPKLMRIDTDETFVINLHGYGSSQVQVYASFEQYPRRRELFSIHHRIQGRADQPITFTMKVPRKNFEFAETIENKQVKFTAKISFPGGSHSTITKTKLIYLTGESDYIFVQTNRPIYKPGEDVEIRVIPLNGKMLPIRETDVFVDVSIQTAEGVGIWRDYRTFPNTDFVTTSYTIPDDPPLGSYFVVAKINNTLHTSKGSTEFKIDKYVLPVYQVTLDLEQSFVKPDGRIEGTFKARYSYGEPVVGSFGFSASVVVPGEDPVVIYKRPSSHRIRPKALIDGGGSISIPISTATTKAHKTWSELMAEGATITVMVSVFGKAEQTFESAQKEGILITNTPYVIDMSQTSKYFVPTIKQNIIIIVRDIVTKNPVPGVRVAINGNRGRGTTDIKGRTKIPIATSNQDQIVVTVRTDDSQLDNEDQAEATFTLSRHRSSGGYLRLSADDSHATVGDTFHVKFRTKNHNPGHINYLVLSKGSIIKWGRHPHNFRDGETSVGITITRKMSPSIRVVGYLMHGNNLVSDSISIDVDDVCISKELTISVQNPIIKPGVRVGITYEGQPGAMLGTSAVDRSAYFLNKKGRLDRDKMFEKMESFDMGCSVAGGGSNGLDVFQGAGLSFTSLSASTASQSNITCPDESSARRRKKRSTGQQVPSHETRLKRICERDGRQENLADLSCDDREKEIKKLDWSQGDETACIEAFQKGCKLGEFIRRSIKIVSETQRSSDSAPGLDVDSQPSNTKRKDFSEGWLWQNHILSTSTGRFSQSQMPPHSITTYDIDALSIHNTEGFCVAKPAEIKVFKDLFVQLYLPYSVKLMEQVQIRVAVFNYHKTQDRQVSLRLKTEEHLCTHNSPGHWFDVGDLTVKNQSSASFVFAAIPLSVPEATNGLTDIELQVISTRDGAMLDHIERKLKIEPSGEEKEFGGSLPLEPNQSRKQIQFEFPDDGVIQGTRKCWIYGHMSYLGPLLEFDPIAETPKNLDNSISLPHGCGEQNMKSVGPNVFVFNYMKFARNPRATEQEQVRQYIIDGYTRQQSHRNRGKWSIWSSAPPTIWLNAYVNRVFLHAREVWPEMDINPICQSMDWIERQQGSNGAFSESAHSRHYWVNVAEGGEVSLTAYVLISVAETFADCPDKSLNSRINDIQRKAESYLREAVPDIPYTAAIVAYALSLANPRHPKTIIANERLLNLKRQNGDEIFWKGPSRVNQNIQTWKKRKQTPIDIETTAYALLAQVELAKDKGSRIEQGTVEMINKIARWMVNQQNDRGGFQSSQTTVVAIQAMTEYAKWIENLKPPPRNPHLNMELGASGNRTWQSGMSFNIDGRNKFYRKELVVPQDVIQNNRVINVDVSSGEGQGTLAYRCVYRQASDSDNNDFLITARTETIGYRADDGESEAAPGEGKNVIKLVLDLQRNADDDTGMAIIEIGLISGFVPIPSTLDALKIGQTVDGVIDDYSIGDEKVIIYVERVPGRNSDSLKFGFKLQQAVTVMGASPAKIVVTEYYKPEITQTKSYGLPGGSPIIRTSCMDPSQNRSTQQLCKCAEGPCPTCRTREDQLQKTCGSRGTCHNSCRHGEDCLKLDHSVCSKNFGYFATITNIDFDTMNEFVKMTAQIDEVIHVRSADKPDRDQTRTFVIRKDCFRSCRDDSLKTLENTDYFAVGRTYLMRGREPEQSTKSNGISFEYYLDNISTIERTLTAEKCAKYEKHRRQCEAQNARTRSDKCKSKLDKLKICDNQKAMRLSVHEGCD